MVHSLWVRETSLSSRRGSHLVPRDSIWSEHLSSLSAHGQPRRRQHGLAKNAGSIHDWVARRVETARISLKHMRRFRLVPHGGQNGARPGFRAIQHRECALGALEDRFCLLGTCVGIGGRAPTQGVHPSAMEVLGARNGQLPLRSRCLPPPYHPLPKTPCVAIGRCRHARPPYLRLSRSLAYIGTRLRELEIIPYMVQTYA